jgi:hypothetical protein
MYQTWCQTLISSQVDSTALTASTTATTILPQAAHFVIPANFFQIGTTLRVRAYGRISTVTTPGTLALAFMLGPTSNISCLPRRDGPECDCDDQSELVAEIMMTCRAIGAGTAANLMGTARFLSRSTLGAPAVGTTLGVGEVLPRYGAGGGHRIDSTVANVADLFATWNTNNANSILTHQYTLESMN